MELLKSVGRESSRLADAYLPVSIKNNILSLHGYIHETASPVLARLGLLLGIDDKSNVKVSIVKIAGVTFVTVTIIYLGYIINVAISLSNINNINLDLNEF